MNAATSKATLWTAAIAFCAGILVAVIFFTMPGAGGQTLPGGAEGSADAGAAMQAPPAIVRFGEAQSRSLRRRTAVVGRLRELQRATVAAEVEGKVLAVPVQEGDPVVGGETVLAEIDGVWARQNLKIAEAQVAAAQATLDQSNLDLDYLEQLLEAQSAKPREVEDQRAKVASNKAQLSAAIAQRDRVAREVERLVVLAPFDGTVTRKITEVGQWVAPGDDIVEVISQGELDAVADVPEKLIDQMSVGDETSVQVDPLGVVVHGNVVAINPNGQNAARTYPVKVRLKDESGKLKPGMSVTVWLPVGVASECLTVPPDAVAYTLEGEKVWVALPGGEGDPMPSAMPVAVRVLFAVDSRMVVEPVDKSQGGMLADGVRVVVEGAESLFPTQKLIDADAPPGPPAGEST